MSSTARVFSACAALVLLGGLSLDAQPPATAGGQDWARGGVCYEIFVRSFYDSDGDGVGDLRGLTQKLDYVNDGDPAVHRDLGASCIWLMPVAQSPSYHGYDVTNYYEVNREYGTNADFRMLVAEAHRRGIRVLVDLVLNHSSAEHPHFKSALLDPSSPYRDWYVWSPTLPVLKGWDAPVWHRAPGREEYYYGLFWSGMPDLNLGNPEVRAEAENIARYWLDEMGVDGFRLDAVAHFFESGDTLRHAPATHPWLRDYAAAVRRISSAAFTIGEVWDSTGAILKYYPDQLDAYFIFDVADALIDAVRSGSKDRLVAAVLRAQRDLPPGRWSPFLRNHDQTRTMTELRGDAARARLAATLLLTLPGFPFLYYGEELGMTGSKPDQRLRTPMHWAMRRAAGFTTGTPWEPLQSDSLTANVEAQDSDRASLLNHHRRLIHLRAAHSALGSGDFVPVATNAEGALAYLRRAPDGTALVVANLTPKRIEGPTLRSDESVVASGCYVGRPLAGGDGTARFCVRKNGQLPHSLRLPPLEPFGSYILDLSQTD
ncbi:MAG: alpha-amylase family glycosyl hydrolase [Gemmatimonadaceae bacterium]